MEGARRCRSNPTDTYDSYIILAFIVKDKLNMEETLCLEWELKAEPGVIGSVQGYALVQCPHGVPQLLNPGQTRLGSSDAY